MLNNLCEFPRETCNELVPLTCVKFPTSIKLSVARKEAFVAEVVVVNIMSVFAYFMTVGSTSNL